MLKGKNIVMGVTGGIAAWKACLILNKLVIDLHANVDVIMTKNSETFITEQTIRTLSRNIVTRDMFKEPAVWSVEHISLARKADCFLIAPCTANVIGKIANGMWLRVSGRMELSFDGKDMQLNPQDIMQIDHAERTDTAEEKRVELHLHTRMSNMDALTDTAAVVKRAIKWGMPAIAITDHGVAQSFPDAWHAGEGKIKILYGVEGYFVNNLDDRIAVHGPQEQAFSDETYWYFPFSAAAQVRLLTAPETDAQVLYDRYWQTVVSGMLSAGCTVQKIRTGAPTEWKQFRKIALEGSFTLSGVFQIAKEEVLAP